MRRLIVVLGYSAGRSDELHPICAARLEHAAGLAGEDDAVLLSGWSRQPGGAPEAELMRRAWPGAPDALLSDPDARITAENAANAAAHARELGVSEVVVVTSSWHRVRARRPLQVATPRSSGLGGGRPHTGVAASLSA